MTDTRQLPFGTQFPVLDKGYIELQDVMGDDLAIVNAARVSFLGESKGEEQDKKLLFYLMRHHHTSPFEQVEFRMRIHAPLVVWWQWVRHRTWHMNAQSGRYTPFAENDFYYPSDWRKQAKSNKQASDGLIEDTASAELMQLLDEHYQAGFALYEKAINAGVARELARLFLPGFSVYYTWVCKVDAHNLMHFLALRMASDAQWEIRQYAKSIYTNIFQPALPWTAEAFQEYRLQFIDVPAD